MPIPGLIKVLINRWHFYLLRLRHLSLSEISVRIQQEAWIIFQKISGFVPCVPAVDGNSLEAVNLPRIKGPVSFDDVRWIMDGGCYTLNHDMGEIRAFEDNWGGKRSGLDIRAVWEPSRLQHVSKLLKFMNDHPGCEWSEKVGQFAGHEIIKWIERNPFLKGPHYRSAMECGLRIPVFVFALKQLQGLKDVDRNSMIRTIYEHAWYISRKLSLYSSLGNHTVCESAGLIFAGILFRFTPAGEQWLKTGIHLMDHEIIHQIMDDGGPAEQSFNYHRFVLDLYWLAVDALEGNGIHDCTVWKFRLETGEQFLNGMKIDKDRLPSIGDSDDGYAVGPGLSPQRGSDDILMEKPFHVFRNSGYTVLNGPSGSALIFDHGPLGMEPLYNHGHADALSVVLYIRGVPFLIDPGTYRYNAAPGWRRYFKSTRAHNTVTVDKKDQAVFETGFIWSHPWRICEFSLNEDPGHIAVTAAHDGYRRLKQPVTHHRTVQVRSHGYLITDTFSGQGGHDFELNYHVHPDVDIDVQDSVWVLKRNSVQCRITLETGVFIIKKGHTGPIHGWYSEGYNRKTPCAVLSCRINALTERAKFITRIDF